MTDFVPSQRKFKAPAPNPTVTQGPENPVSKQLHGSRLVKTRRKKAFERIEDVRTR